MKSNPSFPVCIAGMQVRAWYDVHCPYCLETVTLQPSSAMTDERQNEARAACPQCNRVFDLRLDDAAELIALPVAEDMREPTRNGDQNYMRLDAPLHPWAHPLGMLP